MPLNLTGTFYPRFTENTQRYGPADQLCIQSTVDRLESVQTSAEHPGMLLGKIQSGKTKTVLAIIALAFDNGFDIAIILTKGTKALTRQTLERVNREFGSFTLADQLQIYDIMTIPASLTGYELNQKLVIVCKKQADNMERLRTLLAETYPQLSSKRSLIIDDEADYASVGFRNSQTRGVTANITTQQIDELRGLLTTSAFLQVTATPYSLYLQPENMRVNGNEFRPIKPAFTSLVPVNTGYIGSDYYFDRNPEATVAPFIYQPVGLNELQVLRENDRRRFRVEECLTSDALPILRRAITNFIIGGIIRRLQDRREALPPKKFSFLVHTEASRSAHAWQENIVTTLTDRLTQAVADNPTLLREIFSASYQDLSHSIQALGHYLPPTDDVMSEAFTALRDGWVMITKVNSERQVEELLDAEGQLRLRTPLNIFIGGQILDRGVTIAHLIGFFYGRRPQVYQQDTVLQHSRMFGFRPIQDLSVTRFYTEPQIYEAMRRMHESDAALRQAFEQNPEQPIIFIRRDDRGQVIPCSPNKILVSNTTTLRPFKRILPVGFQTDFAVRVSPVVQAIDRLLLDLVGENEGDPVLIDLAIAKDILTRLKPTLVMETDDGYDFDWEAANAALSYMSNASARATDRGKVWCLVRGNRNISRFINVGATQAYSDAPDTTHVEGRIARQFAEHSPMLMLFRQNGRSAQGWKDTPFFWPVLWAPQNLHTAIFAHETST